jgi:hypothetical protein
MNHNVCILNNIILKNLTLQIMEIKNYSLLWLLLCLSTPIWAATYYLDATGGSNANNGLSPETAWKDIYKIRASLPAPGDVFLFKRGESWENARLYIDASGTATQPIIYGAYGEASAPLPIISSIAPIDGANQSANWTSSAPGTNIWTLAVTATPGRLFLDGVEHLRASTLADLGTTDSEGAFSHWFYDGSSQLLYLYSLNNPASQFNLIAGSQHFATVQVALASHLKFEHLDIRGGWGSSLRINAGSHINVLNCQLGHSANSGISIEDLLVSGVRQPSSYITVSDNTFDSDFTFYYGLGSERGCGDGIKLFYGANNCNVNNNTFINWAHNAIELLGNRFDAAGVLSNQFYDNYITAPDIPYAHPLGVDGLLGKCSDNVFYRNFIENCRTASQINGDNNWVHHNIIMGMRNSPNKATGTGHAFILGIYQNGLVSQNNRFDHNLIIDTDESAFLIRGYGYPGQVQDVAIRNNILYETGQAPKNNAYTQGTGIVIYDTQLDGVGGNTFLNNLFYSSLGNTNAVFVQDDGTYYSTDNFNALNGTDGNLIESNLFGDPLFTDFSNEDYLPMPASPAVNAGLDVGVSQDFALQPRILGPSPDIGPFETNVDSSWFQVRLVIVANKKFNLRWEGLSGRYSSHYLIERKTDNSYWQPIAQVDARLNSEKPLSYIFIDRSPPQGVTVYYRILRSDLDGGYSYSETVQGIIGEQANLLNLIRPDKETIHLVPTQGWDWSKTIIRVIRYDGQLYKVIKGSPMVYLNELPSGQYFLHIQQGDHFEVKRFIR